MTILPSKDIRQKQTEWKCKVYDQTLGKLRWSAYISIQNRLLKR